MSRFDCNSENKDGKNTDGKNKMMYLAIDIHDPSEVVLVKLSQNVR